jgi:transposase
MLVVDAGLVVLTVEQTAELWAVVNSRDVSAAIATRARIVLWMAEGKRRKDVGELAGVSLPTVDRWVQRYAAHGLAGLEELQRGGPREQVPARVRARILALTRTAPPSQTGLSHWSSREMARYVIRTEGVSVSWHYVAKLWRDNDLRPQQQGTFKPSKDPRFAEKVLDVVGLYLNVVSVECDDPVRGAVQDRGRRCAAHARCDGVHEAQKAPNSPRDICCRESWWLWYQYVPASRATNSYT